VRIDLHCHSTASDGTQSPTDVMRSAAAAGLDVVALTDHDSAAGWAEAADAAPRYDVQLVPGMEISTKHEGAGVHLLAYLLDPGYPPLVEELDKILAGRDGRLTSIIAQLRAIGVDITEAEVLDCAGGSPAVGRPHIADVLVRKGMVADRTAAFETLLNPGRPGYVVRYATPTEQMIRLVTEAGGAAVIAHPWGRGSRRVINACTLQEFADAGLVGLEVDHQDHSASDREQLRELATQFDLVVTGASDYHGVGKIDHELGCNLTSPIEFDKLLSRAAEHARRAAREVPMVVGT
jgi:3',5'-nucleoside bisphosphate phosphatase